MGLVFVFLAVLVVLSLVGVLVIIIVANRADPDPKGRRPQSVYYFAVSFVTFALAIFGSAVVVSGVVAFVGNHSNSGMNSAARAVVFGGFATLISIVLLVEHLSRGLATARYRFDVPSGLTVDGSDVWVANYHGNSVTELAGSGSFVRTLSGGSYGFIEPTFVVFDGTDVWVTNQSGKSVTEVKASDGSWVSTYS